MKFAIIIPCYNGEKFLKQSIISALNQTYQDLEVIFVDNDSNDRSLEIALELQKERGKIIVDTAPNLYKYSYQEPVEKALSLTDAEYFTILGADDYITNDYVSNVCEILIKSDKKINFLQSPIRGIKGDTESFVGDLKHHYKNKTELRSMLLNQCPVNTPSMIFNKKLYDDGIIEWNSQEFLGAVDYDCYCRIVDKGHFIYPYPKWLGYYYRWHENQATWGMHKEQTNYDKKIQDFWRSKWKI